MRKGRLPTPPQQLEAAPRRTFGGVLPPAKLERPYFRPGLWLNDQLPNCTAVAMANAALAVVTIDGRGLVIEADRVPAFYAQCVSCAPTMAAMTATEGAVMLDVLAQQQRHSFDIGPQKLSAAYANIATDWTTLRNAMVHMGHVYLGVELYEGDEEAEDWTTDYPAGEPVGGHAILGYDYDGDIMRVATWGGWKNVTREWWDARKAEAHVLAWPQLLSAARSYFDHDTLLAECQSFQVA